MLGYCPNRGPKFLKIIARTNSSVTSIAFGFWIPWDRKKDKNRSSTKKSTSFCQKHQKLSLNFLCYWMIWMLFRSLLDRAGILIWTYLNSRSCGKFGPMLKGERSKHFFPCFSLHHSLRFESAVQKQNEIIQILGCNGEKRRWHLQLSAVQPAVSVSMDFEGILDHYAVLGLEQGCSAAEVRKAFRAKALKWHPDKAGSSAEARRRFQEATDAHEAGILVG